MDSEEERKQVLQIQCVRLKAPAHPTSSAFTGLTAHKASYAGPQEGGWSDPAAWLSHAC